VIERMGTGVVVADPQWRVVDINPAARRMFDIGDKDISGELLSRRVPELEKVLEDIETGSGEGHLEDPSQRELEILNNGRGFFYRVYESPIMDHWGRTLAWVFILTDVTKLKKAQVEIESKNRELTARQERDRLAQDLHDNLGQILSFASIQTQTIQRELKRGNSERVEEYLQRLREIVQEAHSSLRQHVYNIKNDKYETYPFSELIKEMVTTLREDAGLELEFFFCPDVDKMFLPGEEKKQLCYLTQEAVGNIAAHAQASRVSVGTRQGDGKCEFFIEDDGRGIDPRVIADEKLQGAGLSGMRERARRLGGEMKIAASPGEGTRVRVFF